MNAYSRTRLPSPFHGSCRSLSCILSWSAYSPQTVLLRCLSSISLMRSKRVVAPVWEGHPTRGSGRLHFPAQEARGRPLANDRTLQRNLSSENLLLQLIGFCVRDSSVSDINGWPG
ncbi:hypothetical protein BASA61_004344 [Batrachochytrium salamandrivorans]|nr:hypothetical protein BASA61_004344 [Batrachochytrium salamandrivorans]